MDMSSASSFSNGSSNGACGNNSSSSFTSLDVAKKLGLGNQFAFALDCLPFREEETSPILVIDFLQMDAGQKEMVVNFLLNYGGHLIGTGGHAIGFLEWTTLMAANLSLRRAHPEVFYDENGIVFNGQAISRNQTASTVILTPETDKKWTLTEVPQFFEY
uniref:Uncharacterized protein n=2 Tax=Meloidogyne TaxID=189290 RepID=A0A6V7VGR8_MELEN|nr:unnamed protein product [Meloidogyne enterolobii]